MRNNFGKVWQNYWHLGVVTIRNDLDRSSNLGKTLWETRKKKERVEWKKRKRSNFLSTHFTLLWKTPAPNIWKIAKYGLLKLWKKIWNRMLTVVMLDSYLVKMQREPNMNHSYMCSYTWGDFQDSDWTSWQSWQGSGTLVKLHTK